MNVHESGKRKIDDQRSESSSTFSKKKHSIIGPFFYKIIVAPCAQNYTLRIPEYYVKIYYEDQLARDYVKLNINGRVWEVKVIKEEINGRVWLTKGWEKVVEKYCIKHGSFLLFTYDEDTCMFDVSIFDKTCFEIEYDKVFHDLIVDDESQEIKENSSNKDKGHGDGDDDDDDCAEIAMQERCVDIDVDVKREVTKKLEVSKCENPRFEVVMQSRNVFTYTNKCPRMAIPMYHAKNYFKDNPKKQLIILKGANDEKSYYVTLYLQFERSRAEIYGEGWRDFAIDNGLKEEDECVFEMINPFRSNNYMYKVTIFRRSLLHLSTM